MTRPPAFRATAWGGAAATLLYIVAAWASFRGGLAPVRPLYDGTAPPAPYRWVDPPANLATGNQQALPGDGTVEIAAPNPATVATQDGQAVVTIPAGAFEPRPGESRVRVRIEPLAPSGLGPPPGGLHYDGNAYRVGATYQKSGAPATLRAESCARAGEQRPQMCATLVMRYAFGATALFRREGGAWEKVEGGSPVPASLQVFATSPRLGTFVAAGPPVAGSGGGAWSVYVAAAAAAGALLAVGILSARARRAVRRAGRWLSDALYPRGRRKRRRRGARRSG